MPALSRLFRLRRASDLPREPPIRNKPVRAGTDPRWKPSAIRNAPRGADSLVEALKSVLNPADNYGGRKSFRWVAPFSIVIIIVFGIIYLRDRAAGGYKAETLPTHEEDES